MRVIAFYLIRLTRSCDYGAGYGKGHGGGGYGGGSYGGGGYGGGY